WTLSGDVALTLGNEDGSHVTASVGGSYGDHFEKTTSSFTEISFGTQVTASGDDILSYTRTDYQVWEYPVYEDNSNVPTSHMVVVFPLPVGNNQGTRQAFTPGNTCDFWYQPNHQINNVWSYPSNPSQFIDRNRDLNSQILTLGGGEAEFITSWSSISSTQQASEITWGVNARVEVQVGGDEIKIPIIDAEFEVPWSVKATVEGSYGQSSLSTNEAVGSSSTSIRAHFNPIGSSASYEVQPFLYWSKAGYLVLDYIANPVNGTAFWSRYDKPDPALLLPWADGACGADRTQFTKEIAIYPAFVSNGEIVSITAALRNFSNVGTGGNVRVRFYQGDPASGGTQIGSDQIIPVMNPRDRRTVTTQWTASGTGEQRIYVVMDPDNQITEMHEDNNKGYGLVRLASTKYVDPGVAGRQDYFSLAYTTSEDKPLTAFIPTMNFTATMRFEVIPLTAPSTAPPPGLKRVGQAFTLNAYQGGIEQFNMNLRPSPGQPPGAVSLQYADADIAGMNEAALRLYVQGGPGWEEALCAGHAYQRFPNSNTLIVPVCRTGTFALFGPGGPLNHEAFLPLLLKARR
ncbi:MAG: hypothetical protein IT330_05965, partial [Anaerolineae bacterium]|nr:hypothetical protein [Anaerolineae bacterium]